MFLRRVSDGYEPARGDIVLLHPADGEGTVIRRIIGLPGEEVELRNEDVYVNGARVEEPWLPSELLQKVDPNRPPYFYGPFRVPGTAYFVLGDNRQGPAADSRTFGAVPRDRVHGRVWTLFGKPVTL
jgi:signal peptidase I